MRLRSRADGLSARRSTIQSARIGMDRLLVGRHPFPAFGAAADVCRKPVPSPIGSGPGLRRIDLQRRTRRGMDRVSSMLSFVKVVEQGGFSAAGRQLNLATSVVTTHVKSLEERLQVRLLNRTTRSVSLTEAGRAYYERCVQILSEIEDAEEAAQVLQSKQRGILRLNTSPGIPQLIAPSIAEYSDLYPDVTVHLAATGRMLDLVEEGFDLAIWFAAVADPSLIVRRLAHYRMIICSSPEYLAKRGRPKHPSELTKHDAVIFYDAPTLGKHGREWQFT